MLTWQTINQFVVFLKKAKAIAFCSSDGIMATSWGFLSRNEHTLDI